MILLGTNILLLEIEDWHLKEMEILSPPQFSERTIQSPCRSRVYPSVEYYPVFGGSSFKGFQHAVMIFHRIKELDPDVRRCLRHVFPNPGPRQTRYA